MERSPLDLLLQGLRAKAPFSKATLGTVVLMAGYAIVASLTSTPRAAIFAAAFMICVGVIVTILSVLGRPTHSKAIAYPALFIAWSLSVLFVFCLLATFTSFFFAWPTEFARLWADTRQLAIATTNSSSTGPVERSGASTVQSNTTAAPAPSVEPAYEEITQDIEYSAGNGRSCTERDVTRTHEYCAVPADSNTRAEVIRYEGPVQRYGRNSSSSIQINSPRSGCATVTLRYSDYGRGPFGDCRGHGNISVSYKLFIRREATS